MKMITQFVILVHPCVYEARETPVTDPFRVREMLVCRRWLEGIPGLSKSTFAVILDSVLGGPSPDRLFAAFIDRLGVRQVARIPCAWVETGNRLGVGTLQWKNGGCVFEKDPALDPSPASFSEWVSPQTPVLLKEYHDRIGEMITRQMTTQGLAFDPVTCRTLVWGESFEGCAPGFGSAIASGLGLRTPTTLDYEMCVPDAAFLLTAVEPPQTMAVPDCDIEAQVFDLADGRHAALFRSTLTPQWLDHRALEVRLDAGTCVVVTKEENKVWPAGTSEAKLCRFRFSTVDSHFFIATDREAILAMAASCKLKEGPFRSQCGESGRFA